MNTCAFMSHANNLFLVAISLKSEHSQQPNCHTPITDRHNLRLFKVLSERVLLWRGQKLSTIPIRDQVISVSMVNDEAVGWLTARHSSPLRDGRLTRSHALFLTSQLPHRSLQLDD